MKDVFILCEQDLDPDMSWRIVAVFSSVHSANAMKDKLDTLMLDSGIVCRFEVRHYTVDDMTNCHLLIDEYYNMTAGAF